MVPRISISTLPLDSQRVVRAIFFGAHAFQKSSFNFTTNDMVVIGGGAMSLLMMANDGEKLEEKTLMQWRSTTVMYNLWLYLRRDYSFVYQDSDLVVKNKSTLSWSTHEQFISAISWAFQSFSYEKLSGKGPSNGFQGKARGSKNEIGFRASVPTEKRAVTAEIDCTAYNEDYFDSLFENRTLAVTLEDDSGLEPILVNYASPDTLLALKVFALSQRIRSKDVLDINSLLEFIKYKRNEFHFEPKRLDKLLVKVATHETPEAKVGKDTMIPWDKFWYNARKAAGKDLTQVIKAGLSELQIEFNTRK
ncbi:hypothetical protein VKT23_013013 [Stygiomarasmius scandens]|uniref:Uncharacterized protein n=1 Tax=Marasmiellus scandens TaxID=2682957 RepID=A0ABR1J479_9AGAR